VPPVSPAMSFFITSTGRGFGANLGGVTGADAICRQRAAAVGHGDRLWRAYLSAPASADAPAVHARDRIGRGPWFNAQGIQIAASVDELHGESVNLTRDTALTEAGAQVAPTRHDILTGSNADGTLFTKGDATCRGWTSHGDGRAMVGHHNRSGGGQGDSWNSAHLWAMDSSTASPPIDNAERNQASTLLYQSVEVGMNNLKRRLFHNEEGAIGYIVAWFLGVPAIVLFAIFVLRGCN